MSERMPRLFPGADPRGHRSTTERSSTGRTSSSSSGGDPTLGAKALARHGRAGLAARGARARGAPAMGVSAGAIVLGAWWVDWPEDEEARARAQAGLVACIGDACPGHVFDTHDEEDDWEELHVAARAPAAARREGHACSGFPTGGALVFDAYGAPWRSWATRPSRLG